MLKRNTPPDTKDRPKPKKEMNIFQPSIFRKKVSFCGSLHVHHLYQNKCRYLQKKHAQPAQDQRNLVQQLAAKT